MVALGLEIELACKGTSEREIALACLFIQKAFPEGHSVLENVLDIL